jgi:hypothetical protein
MMSWKCLTLCRDNLPDHFVSVRGKESGAAPPTRAMRSHSGAEHGGASGLAGNCATPKAAAAALDRTSSGLIPALHVR